MAEAQAPPPGGPEDAEVFLSASDDEAAQQVVTPELLSALVKQVSGYRRRHRRSRSRAFGGRSMLTLRRPLLQVEFYFSDANLPTDKKLLKQIRKDSEGFGKSECD